MDEIQISIEGVLGAEMTRELARRVNAIGGLEGSLSHKPGELGSKSAVGQAAFALIKIVGDNAIGPLIDLLSHFLTRDKRARIKVKFPNGVELEIESANMNADLKQVRNMLVQLL